MPIAPTDPLTEITGRRLLAALKTLIGLQPEEGPDYGDRYTPTQVGTSTTIADPGKLFEAHCIANEIAPAAWSNGDQVLIAVTKPNGLTANATYTYAAGDTVQALMDAIQTAFDSVGGGDVTLTLVAGEFVVTDDVAGASQTACTLTFNNVGPSDTAWTLGAMAVDTAGSDAVARLLTADGALTVSAAAATGATVLNTLDGIAGDALDGNETLTLNGNDNAGSPVVEDTVLLTQTVADLLAAIDALWTTGTSAINASGVITWTQDTPGAGNQSTIVIGFDDPANAAVAATGVLTATDIPVDTDTVTIGATVYTFKNTLASAFDVQRAGTASESLDNLIAAINLTGTEGVEYGAGTTEHPDVGAAAGVGDTVDITADVAGAAGNSIATSVSSANLSWGDVNLTGGVDAEGTSTYTPPTMDVTAAGANAVARVIDGPVVLLVSATPAIAGDDIDTLDNITGTIDAAGYT